MLEAGYSEINGGSEGKKEREGGSFDGDGAEPVENLPTNAEIWWLRCLCLLLPTLSLSLSLSSASLCGQSRRLVAEDMKTMLWNESTRLAYSCAAGCDLSRGCRAKKKKKQKKGNRSRTHNVIETTDIELNLSNIAIGSEIWNELRPHRKQKLKKGCNMKVRKRMSGGGKGEETGGLLSGECRWKTLLCCCCCSACHSISIRVHHGECFYCGYLSSLSPLVMRTTPIKGEADKKDKA